MTGIFFDIDDTLYSRQDLLVKAAAMTLAQGAAAAGDSDVQLDRDAFMRIFYRKSEENFALVQSGKITPWESNVWRLEETFREMGLPCPEKAGKFFADTYTDMQNRITLSPVMEEMLANLSAAAEKKSSREDCSGEGSGREDCSGEGSGLKGGGVRVVGDLRIGILTNGSPEHQWKKYRMLGLERWIPEKYVIVSGDVGVSKPDREIFRIAERSMVKNERPAAQKSRGDLLPAGEKGHREDGAAVDFWMVGDSMKHDILGAKTAGWHTVWLDRRGLSDRMQDCRMQDDRMQDDRMQDGRVQDGPAQNGPADVTVHNETELSEAVLALLSGVI